MPKTLAELKRYLKPGMILDTVHYSGWKPGPRSIAFTNSVGFGLNHPTEDRISNCDWPKASDIQFTENGFTIFENEYFDPKTQTYNRVPLLTYTFVTE